MASTGTPKNPTRANLLNHHSIKQLLDESVTELVTGKGYTEDTRRSNVRLLIGSVIIAVALAAQFHSKKFSENQNFLIGCIGLYVVLHLLLQFISYTKVKNAILFTNPPAGSVDSKGLIVSSKLPRFSDLYTLSIVSKDPQSISGSREVQFTTSVTKWFSKDGILVEGIFSEEVERLMKMTIMKN